jgi:hypothetical protein
MYHSLSSTRKLTLMKKSRTSLIDNSETAWKTVLAAVIIIAKQHKKQGKVCGGESKKA